MSPEVSQPDPAPADGGGLDPEKLGIPILRLGPVDGVVLKPAGMATELTRDPRGESLLARLKHAAAPGVIPRLVHRLDRPTRGLVVVALTKDAAAYHGEQIREGLWDKYYLARIPWPRSGPRSILGLHKAHLREEDNRSRIVHSGGKLALLEVLAVEPAPGRTTSGEASGDQRRPAAADAHALIRLLTGRLHQVRVMMAGLGVPLVGDDVYAADARAGHTTAGFYLEHIALRHRAADTHEEVVSYLRNDPDRELVSPALLQRLESELEMPKE